MSVGVVPPDPRILRERIVAMGYAVERAIEGALACVFGQVGSGQDEVWRAEDEINSLHKAIDREAIAILSKGAVGDKDLRLVFAIIKMNTDLERMGDQAINLTQTRHRGPSLLALKADVDLPRMARDVTMMVKDSLAAFAHENAALAQNVLILDDLIDNLKRQAIQELMALMKKDSSSIEPALDLISVAKNLERLADHATNIAEDVIFIQTGEDVRHLHGGPERGVAWS